MRETAIEQTPTVEGLLAQINQNWENIPEYKVDEKNLQHLTLICDGNRRSAENKGLAPNIGHRLGVEVIKGIVKAAKEWGIRHITFWTFSTENWHRNSQQVDFLMGLMKHYLQDDEVISVLIKNKARFVHIGRKDRLPMPVRQAIINLEKRTEKYHEYYVNLAVDYGGIDEVARAIPKILKALSDAKLTEKELLDNPEVILKFLDTASQPLPDFIVRTGYQIGEIPRTSGFMPLQSGYSGWAYIEDLFPDLTPQSLLQAIQEFSKYKRRFGK